ncbi:hypothetical protein [Lederbergia lenta]|nr:hypothetical protein [Lederbergia lenta]
MKDVRCNNCMNEYNEDELILLKDFDQTIRANTLKGVKNVRQMLT